MFLGDQPARFSTPACLQTSSCTPLQCFNASFDTLPACRHSSGKFTPDSVRLAQSARSTMPAASNGASSVLRYHIYQYAFPDVPFGLGSAYTHVAVSSISMPQHICTTSKQPTQEGPDPCRLMRSEKVLAVFSVLQGLHVQTLGKALCPSRPTSL